MMRTHMRDWAAAVTKKPEARRLVSFAGRLLDRVNLKGVVADYLFGPRVRPFADSGTVEEVLRSRLAAIAASEEPIIVGPWISEVGFEILYWIPFVRWATKTFRISPSRLVVVSRGGNASWYGTLAYRYVDVFDHVTPGEFRTQNEERLRDTGLQKHLSVSGLDRLILERAGLSKGVQLLHPELMYGLFSDYWSGAAGFSRIADHVSFTRVDPPSHPALAALPERYVAIKFYSRPSLPLDESNAAFVERFILQTAERTPVVLLTTGIAVDDHGEFPTPRHPNVLTLEGWWTPRENLALQSAVIARATRVYCTYGGFSYLPLTFGVPATSFFSVDKHFLKFHACAAYYMASKLRASLSVVDVTGLEP